AYGDFVEGLRSGPWIAFGIVAFALALYHTVTWFKLTGKVMFVRLGRFVVPPLAITLGQYALWIVVSVIVAFFLIRG
ncbi:MAG: fumarate reductase subunit C, partial [Vicinamibacteria bacterium]